MSGGFSLHLHPAECAQPCATPIATAQLLAEAISIAKDRVERWSPIAIVDAGGRVVAKVSVSAFDGHVRVTTYPVPQQAVERSAAE